MTDAPARHGAAAAPILHATLVARRMQGHWAGALLRGPSGAGKSELALRAVAAGWRLVADDRVTLWASGGGLYGAAPPRLAGLIEARGLGVLAEAALPFARIRLVVDACPPGAAPERMPEPRRERLLDLELQAVRLAFTTPAAVTLLSRALEATAAGLV